MVRAGIVGLPNVGKSTLFNALLEKQVADVANYPFCTIEPNKGIIHVPDARLEMLAKIVRTERIVPAVVEFYDIAGLVKGASEGEGLGNKFLSHIREVDLILHIVRLFQESEIIHVTVKIDPFEDISIINNELILADLATLTRQKEPKGNATKEERAVWQSIQKLITYLDRGERAETSPLTENERTCLRHLNLLTFKKMVYVFNVSEAQLLDYDSTRKRIAELIGNTQECVLLCAKLEYDMASLSRTDKRDYLSQYPIAQSGIDELITKSYTLLNLISFLTAGEKEVRAWTITKGMTAPQASGVIHTDFEKHFIKAEVVPFNTFVSHGGWKGCRERGVVTLAGRDYIMQEGDVVDFKVNV